MRAATTMMVIASAMMATAPAAARELVRSVEKPRRGLDGALFVGPERILSPAGLHQLAKKNRRPKKRGGRQR